MCGNSNIKESILLIENNPEIRKRLAQAARAEKLVSFIRFAGSLDEGLRLLREDRAGDMVFISHKFEQDEVLDFVLAAKNTKVGQDSAFIMLLEDEKRDKSLVAENLLRGVDGFLAIPFTVDLVQEAIKIAAGIKNKKLIKRVAAASRLILSNCICQIDYTAYDSKRLGKALCLSDDTKEAASILRTFDSRELEVYYQIVFEMLSKSKPPKEYLYFETSYANSKSNLNKMTLQEALVGSDWQKKAHAIDQIIRMNEDGGQFVPHLMSLMNDKNSSCRRKAKLALAKLGVRNIPPEEHTVSGSI